MDRLRLIFISIGLSVLVRGQQIANYVSNGGFEKYISCSPTFSSLGYIGTALNWDGMDVNCAAKWNHYCYNAVPFNSFFYNYPRTDSAYVSYDIFCLSCPLNDSRANIRNTLKAPLVSGRTYCVKFYLNNSEYSSFSIDAIDAYFGGAELDTITKASLPLTFLNPQISNPLFNYLSDTVGWSSVSGTMTAQGGEKYMVIGNFRTNATTNTIISNSSPSSQQWSFCTIAIDDVSCIDIELPAYAGPDTYVVPGGSVYIGRPRDVGIDNACIWYKLPNTVTSIDTAAGIWVSPIATSTYMIVQDICGNIKSDTVVVSLSGVGISEIEFIRNNIKLFPNPTETDLTVTFGSQADINKISIINSFGQTIREEDLQIQKTEFTVSTSDLDKGIYLIQFKTSAGTVTKTFVKN